MQAFAAGARNRLVTYADIAPSGSEQSGGKAAGGTFWIATRAEAVKLYLAGNTKSNGSSERDYGTGARNRLLSYAFIDDWARDEFGFWVARQPDGVSVFLDSGAFSAHTLGRRIDLDQYCAYVERHRAALAAYAVLDVIGDAEATLVNLQAMRARGLDPVAIYHVKSEPLAVLEQVLSDHTGYIALGGMASERATVEEVRGHLDACWRVLERHWPVRVHALGVMAQWALERYPFYSADGSSAIVAAGMGRVMRFSEGRMEADGWQSDLKRTWDGIVADGVGRVAAAPGKSDSAHEGRRLRNIQAQLALERYVTDLWAQRGVTWPEQKGVVAA